MLIRDWPEPVVQFMRMNSSLISRAMMAQEISIRFDIDCTVSTIKNAYRIHGITGMDSRFKPGHQPTPNNGHQHPNSVATRFKSGQKPVNTAKIGDERIADGYVQVKVTETGYPPIDWIPKHRLIWEAANGRIPTNHILRFIDGDKTNIALDNLLLVSRAENAVMNRWLNINELPEGGLIAVHLIAKIKIRSNELQHRGRTKL